MYIHIGIFLYSQFSVSQSPGTRDSVWNNSSLRYKEMKFKKHIGNSDPIALFYSIFSTKGHNLSNHYKLY